jgi:hypothetical protein
MSRRRVAVASRLDICDNTSSVAMHTFWNQSIARRLGWLTGWAGVVSLALLSTGGCSPQSTAAGAVAAVAADALTQAATQPSTPPAPAVKAQPAAAQALVGRWVFQKRVSYADGTPAPDAIAVIVFNRDGSYETSSKAGYGPLVVARGTYKAFGNSVTTRLGKASSQLTYRIQGSNLVLVNNATRQEMLYHRG